VSVYVVLVLVWGTLSPSLLKPNINYNLGSYGYLNSRLKEAKQVSDVDIVFLGSSHTSRGFDNRIFAEAGYSSFNLGSAAQTPVQTQLLVERYLDSLSPELVIYEVYPAVFMLDGIESALDVVSNDKNDWLSLKMASKINQLKVYNTYLYSVLRDLIRLDDDYVEPIKFKKDTYISGGYIEKMVYFNEPKSYTDSIEFYIPDFQLESFEFVINAVKASGAELKIVYAPITKVLYRSYTNNDYFDKLMTKYGDYRNYNKVLKLNDTVHFYDDNHLNQLGVKVFNEKVIEDLAQGVL